MDLAIRQVYIFDIPGRDIVQAPIPNVGEGPRLDTKDAIALNRPIGLGNNQSLGLQTAQAHEQKGDEKAEVSHDKGMIVGMVPTGGMGREKIPHRLVFSPFSELPACPKIPYL